jgi:hypothetical protein
VFLAILICSDEGCDAVVEAVGELHELEALVCECDCTLQIVQLSEAVLEHPSPRALEPPLPRAA